MQIEHAIHGLDDMKDKAERLSEIMQEAKALAEELASCDVAVSFEVIK